MKMGLCAKRLGDLFAENHGLNIEDEENSVVW